MSRRSSTICKQRPMTKPSSRRDPISRVREICLSFPGAFEKEAWGGPTFRAAHGMFAMYVDNHHGDGIVGVWIKAPLELQEILVGSDPKRFFKPPYVGHKGWVGLRLDVAVDWDETAHLLREGYEMACAKQRIPRPRRRRRPADDVFATPARFPIPARWE